MPIRVSTAPLVALLFLSLTCLASCEKPDRAVAEIELIIHKNWDRPDNAVLVGPIAVAESHAVADWTQGDRGGRALAKKDRDGLWAIILCGGDALRGASSLQALGVSVRDSHAIAAKLREQEASIAPQRLKAMASFEGIVRM